jgi:mannosyl-oligosaccharide glucosidase
MYHAPDSIDIRHLASDHQGAIRSYAFTRHDGASFADHKVEDTALNTLVSSSFLRHHTAEHAWALRISGAPLDPSVETGHISLVFYAAAGPEELDAGALEAIRSKKTGPWGTVGVAESTIVGSSGISGDCVLEGSASSVGGTYRVVLREPSQGGLPPDADASLAESSSTSRRRGRRRSARSQAGPDLSRFHVGTPAVDPGKAFLVDEIMRALLLEGQPSALPGGGDGGGAAGDTDDGARDGSNARDAPRYFVLPNEPEGGAPVVLVQRIVQVPFQVDVVFSMSGVEEASVVSEDLAGRSLDRHLASRRAAFDSRFEDVFGMANRGYGAADVAFARTALANVLGGIGYFYGSTVVGSGDGKEAMRAPAELLTSTPSRALFPRGFLWDEGFHQLLVQRWDVALSRECLGSWLKLVDGSGWIPREQVLGLEARHRFPDHVKHLMIQTPTIANPPTLLMPLRVFAAWEAGNGSDDAVSCGAENRGGDSVEDGMCRPATSPPSSSSVGDGSGGSAEAEFMRRSLDSAVKTFEWLRRTQAGEKAGTFRWRGRSSTLAAPEGYPLTLASGLDDYPRGRGASEDERHLDLHSWVAWAAGALAKLHRAAGRDAKDFDRLHRELVGSLEGAHQVSGGSGAGGSGEGGVGDGAADEGSLLLCDYGGRQSVCHRGYVTILPFVLGLLDASSARVGAVLDLLEDEDELRSVAGVRSLSRRSPYYRKGNDYWTGSVWMPFNYLALAALRSKYSVEEGPYRDRAAALFLELKRSVLDNARREFERTGFLWENYSPDDGRGKSGRQFTGWSALVVLMYADMYDGVVAA